MRFVCAFALLIIAACSSPDTSHDAATADAATDAAAIDAAAIDAAVIDAAISDAAAIDAAVIDAPMVDAAVIDAVPTDAAPTDAVPPDAAVDGPPPGFCACDTGAACQSGCACDPGCGPLRCAPLLPSLAYFVNRGGSLQGIAMADATHGWAVGSSGKIFRLTGTTVELVESPTANHLYDVDVVDADTGWATGVGEILRLQGGVWRRWTDYTPPGLLTELDLVDDANGLAVGYDGLVAQLRDGVWSTIDIGATQYMSGVVLFDRDNGWAFSGERFQLRDGVWSSTPGGPGEGIYSAALIDRDTGWGVGRQNTSVQRLSGGTWTPTTTHWSSPAYAIQLQDLATGWAITFDNGPMKLVAGEWTGQSCTDCSGLGDMDIKGGRGWAVGYRIFMLDFRPTLVRIDTSTPTWGPLAIAGGTMAALVTVAVTGESVGWAAGAGGLIMRLTPSGWTANPSLGITDTFRGMALSDATHGWAVGGNGRIARLNGTWTLASTPTAAPLYGVAIAGVTAWAAGGASPGRPGTILRYDGVSWSVDPIVASAEVHAIALTDAANGWAVGGNALGTSGTILRLEAGVWTTVMTTPGAPLWSIALDAVGNGWAVGGTADDGVPVIWRLVAGVWTQIPFSGTTMLHGVAVDRDGLGWIVGTNATVVAIDGAGVTACPNAMPWPTELSAVVLTPAGRAWTVGTEGMRARTP